MLHRTPRLLDRRAQRKESNYVYFNIKPPAVNIMLTPDNMDSQHQQPKLPIITTAVKQECCANKGGLKQDRLMSRHLPPIENVTQTDSSRVQSTGHKSNSINTLLQTQYNKQTGQDCISLPPEINNTATLPQRLVPITEGKWTLDTKLKLPPARTKQWLRFPTIDEEM